MPKVLRINPNSKKKTEVIILTGCNVSFDPNTENVQTEALIAEVTSKIEKKAMRICFSCSMRRIYRKSNILLTANCTGKLQRLHLHVSNQRKEFQYHNNDLIVLMNFLLESHRTQIFF